MSKLLENRKDRMKDTNMKVKRCTCFPGWSQVEPILTIGTPGLHKMADTRLVSELKKQLNKEKERLKDCRSNNGHLFTSITVCSTTLCSSCNRSFTSKEALSCPACNATIHNRCRDSLASCAKMKQRQQKLAKNTSGLQNVTMRSKTPVLSRERPSSAVYPSEGLRGSLLGSRRVRSGLGLAKSVSTNNIAGLRGEESVGLRRILSQSTESLNFRSRTWSMESLTDDGEWWWSPLLEELQLQGSCVQADSWSLTVDTHFLQTLHKDLIRQQDVIYELIQTEFHHVRTLRIMEGVYRRGLQEEVGLESSLLHSVFPCLDRLLELHKHFLSRLLLKRQEGLTEGSSNNYTVRGLGQLLLTQLCGQTAEDMKKVYSEFCSRHPKAVKTYKEVLSRDRRLQQFIRRVCRGPLLRRHGVQECLLLVTQRITKYPVLLQRVLDHTKGGDREPLSRALTLMKELVSAVDQEVLERSRCGRLQEVTARLDPRAQTEVQDGGVFRGGELLRRKLLHDGALLWKLQGSRMKDVQVLLMSDILVFLQEKDQKLSFASLDKSPVVSLTKLIVRDIANQERGLYLISDSAPPVMYELHAASKEERRTWMSRIQEAARGCPSRDQFPLIETEGGALVRRLRAEIQQKDREVLELLEERGILISDLWEASAEPLSSASNRKLFRVDSTLGGRAEPVLQAAIAEVDKLSELLSEPNRHMTSTNGTQTASNESCLTDGSSKDRNGNQLQGLALTQEVRQRLVGLSVQLHALQAAVIRQDSMLELPISSGHAPSFSAPSFIRSASLQEEVTSLKEEELNQGRRSSNGESKEQVSGRRGSKDLELAPLATPEPVDQSDGPHQGDQQEVKISPRSESPRDLQDIPEESES